MNIEMGRANPLILRLAAVLIFGNASGVMLEPSPSVAAPKIQSNDIDKKADLMLASAGKNNSEPQNTTIGRTNGVTWPPLTPAEIANLAEKLKTVPKSRAQIKYENPLGIDLANSLMAAFTMAGWDDVSVSIGTTSGPGILIGWNTRAVSIKTAIKSVSRLEITAIRTDREVSDLILVKIGVNTAK